MNGTPAAPNARPDRRWFLRGAAAGLAAAASAFSTLGLKPDLVGKAVPVLTSFVSKSGGADVGRMLAGALK